MEASVSNQKTIERVVSHRALQMGNSFSCQICVVGFLCGVCIASLLVAALTLFGAFGLSGVSMSSISMGISQLNTSSNIINIFSSSEANIKLKETRMKKSDSEREEEEGRASLVYSAWSIILKEPRKADEVLLHTLGLTRSMVPEAPHLEDCKSRSRLYSRLDNRENDEKFPPWTSWKGALDTHPASTSNDQFKDFRRQQKSQGTYPPWVVGSDEENYPMTRRVQRDVWIHQHPLNCSKDSSLRFLVADWERLAGFGIGAQFAGMCGLLAIALKEKRILVTNYYNRADHDGCKGKSRGSWSCYFLRETSQECRDRALELTTSEEAWAKGIITSNNNYTSKQIWAGRIPRLWGEAWNYLQPTTEINGSLIASHRKMDRRWWRAQGLRYLMRFQTEYTCGLMNAARHASFGMEAAKNVVATLGNKWPKEGVNYKMVKSDIEEFVWSNHRPWVPRPLLSIHVRMGDKACEMKVVEFEEYMRLANRIRTRFPHLKTIWISTEMQEVIDKTSEYKKQQWNFYYTADVKRQVGNVTMAAYERSLGRERSTNYPLVNFLMASDADFFIGALGSTWCFLIDAMRNTAGKVMAGYLSVNKDRFW